ncbi:MAG: methylmalonyl Co-A mutase-associated GTPase MeaB [Bacteroidetes bacterium]|nr:methylmalonyl Co-A mutase-associated GTPase MeaB [Bacteroidota bacterium]MCB0852140.1 methylmalonyl Co-A mutase-associated GTPase MeaB [Bacteroidota bacterium]
MRRKRLTSEEYLSGILAGDRLILSRAITLVESNLESDQEIADQVLNGCIQTSQSAYKIAISGVPGVGKSTFIEGFGIYLIEQGHQVAVLSIDPSSTISKGSILGDKTRMEQLSTHPQAFVRPSPTLGALGGVSDKTREVSILCAAAGFDRILIETVGVGQSEVKVKQMVDFFLLLMLPNAGDELQGIKRGIIEIADSIVINKSDGELKVLAQQAKASYSRALHFFAANESKWTPQIMTCSALNKQGFDEIYQVLSQFQKITMENGYWMKNREKQNISWMEEAITHYLLWDFQKDPRVKNKKEQLSQKMIDHQISPRYAARKLMEIWRNPSTD